MSKIEVIVTEIHRGEIISYLDGKKIKVKIPRRFLHKKQTERILVTVGDRINIIFDKKAKSYLLQKQCERRNQISRQDPFLAHLSHVIAANIDYLGIVISLREPDVDWELIDRYLITADKYDIPTLLILNKHDLITPEEEAELPLDVYRNLGVKVILTSGETAYNIEALKELVSEKTTLFSGPSGAGKSTLINFLEPAKQQKTASVSAKNSRGRHTTRATRLIPLKIGGYIIDSPGITGLGLDQMSQYDIQYHYQEFIPFVTGCKYGNTCTHTHERPCGVKDALEAGKLADFRFKHYLNILENPTSMLE